MTGIQEARNSAVFLITRLHHPSGALVTLDPSIIIPSLKLDFRILILETSSDGAINVRPTGVLDQTQTFPDLMVSAESKATNDSLTSRLNRGTLLSDRVPIGAVDPSTRVMPDASAPSAFVRDLHSSMILSDSHVGQSSQISDTVRKPFFPHMATLIVALRRYQLEDILPCQLQLSFVNNGQFMYTNHAKKRPALAPAPSHLAMKILDIIPRVSNNVHDRNEVELFSVQIEMSGERLRAFVAAEGLSDSQVSSPEFNNYRFSVNYIPRTNVSIQNYSCPTEPQFSVNYAKLLSLIEPFSDRVHVPIMNAYPSPPFQIVLSSSSFHVVVDVVSVKSSSVYSPLFLTKTSQYK